MLVLTAGRTRGHAHRPLAAGADAVLPHDAPDAALLGALRAVCAGAAVIGPSAPGDDYSTTDLPTITAREHDVAAAVALGWSNVEIADELDIGVETVKTHVSALLHKLGARNRVELAVHAYRTGLTATSPDSGNALPRPRGTPLPTRRYRRPGRHHPPGQAHHQRKKQGMNNRRIRRLSATTALAALLVTGAGVTTATAGTPTSDLREALVATTTLPQAGLTSAQWRQIAAAAEQAGDTTSAQAARAMASKANGGQQTQVVDIAVKAAIKAALKHGRHLLPSKIRPYADKLYGLVDQIDNLAEAGLFAAFVNAGLPPDVARVAAQWIVTFA